MRTYCTGAIATRGSYSEYSLPLYMYNVSCNGEEASVFDCSHTQTNNGVPSCSQSEDAGVICQGLNVMCLDGILNEFFSWIIMQEFKPKHFHMPYWVAACRYLCYHCIDVSIVFQLMLLQKCYLTRLFLFAASPVEPSNCTDYDVSLAEGATANEGKIKVCLNHFWGTVCDGYLDTTDASVLCRQLGFPSLGIHLVEKYYQYKFIPRVCVSVV